MTVLSLPVDDATATAYRAAPPAEQDRLAGIAAALLRFALRPHPERGEALGRAADALGAEAQSRGWTDDLDAALLRGDLDGE